MSAVRTRYQVNHVRDVLPILFLIFMLALAGYMPVAKAQANPEISNCEELKDEATITQMDFCTAHVGCRLVMGIHAACAKVKKFINNLKSIGDRDSGKDMQEQSNSVFGKFKSLLGGKPTITSNQVFEASLSDEARALEAKDSDWRDRSTVVKAGVAKAGDSTLSGKFANGGSWTYVGDTSNGQENGWGTKFYSNGVVARGEFKNGQADGQADVTFSDGQRHTGLYSQNKLNGDGLAILRSGNVYKGKFQAGDLDGSGAIYSPDGTLLERGIYEKDKLTNGEIFDSTGKVVKRVDKVMDAMLAAEAQQKTQAERMAREAEVRRIEEERQRAVQLAAEQKRKDAAAATERAYRDSLNSMNAGQLFAKADELTTSGDKTKAREVLRTLLSRFPDHALAATAAQQMAERSGNGVVSGSTSSASTSPSKHSSICIRNSKKIEAFQQRLGLKMYGATNDRFMINVNNLWAQLMQPCISADPKAKEFFDHARREAQSVESYCRGTHQNYECLEWGSGTTEDGKSASEANRRWFNAFSTEFNKALSDPNYSSDLDGGANTVIGRTQSGGNGDCDALIAAQEREFEAVNQRPMPDGATPPLRRVMWMTSQRIKLVRANCPNISKYQQMIKELQTAYDQSDKACGQMMAGNVCPGPNAY